MFYKETSSYYYGNKSEATNCLFKGHGHIGLKYCLVKFLHVKENESKNISQFSYMELTKALKKHT